MGAILCMQWGMPILAQRHEHRAPPQGEGFAGLERGLFAGDGGPRGARGSPHTTYRAGPGWPHRPAAAVWRELPPPPPLVAIERPGVPLPVLDDGRAPIPMDPSYRIVADPRA